MRALPGVPSTDLGDQSVQISHRRFELVLALDDPFLRHAEQVLFQVERHGQFLTDLKRLVLVWAR